MYKYVISLYFPTFLVVQRKICLLYHIRVSVCAYDSLLFHTFKLQNYWMDVNIISFWRSVLKIIDWMFYFVQYWCNTTSGLHDLHKEFHNISHSWLIEQKYLCNYVRYRRKTSILNIFWYDGYLRNYKVIWIVLQQQILL